MWLFIHPRWLVHPTTKRERLPLPKVYKPKGQLDVAARQAQQSVQGAQRKWQDCYCKTVHAVVLDFPNAVMINCVRKSSSSILLFWLKFPSSSVQEFSPPVTPWQMPIRTLSYLCAQTLSNPKDVKEMSKLCIFFCWM